MTSKPVLTFALAFLSPVLARAAPVADPAPPVAQKPPPQVSELLVVRGPAPSVVSSYPADGASVPGGVLVLKIAFDQPMTDDAWAYGKADGGQFPSCLAHPRLLNDKHTFSLLCTVSPNETYAITINPAPRFTAASGLAAKPYVLKFTTTDVGVRDMHTALIQAGLTDIDDPIMTWRDDGKGVSQSAAQP